MTLEDKIRIRLADEADVPVLRVLVNEAYRQLADLGLNYTGTYQDEQITRNRMQDKEVYLAFLDNQPVGTISLRVEQKKQGRVLYISQVAVDPARQRQGIGKLLLQLAKQRAIELGISTLQLDTAIPATHLVNMYTKAGFQVIEEVHWRDKTYNSYIMQKLIT